MALAAVGALQVFAVQVIAFVLVVGVLLWFVKPVLARTLEARSRAIEETFRGIEAEGVEVRRQLDGLQEKIDTLEQEARRRHEAAAEEVHRLRVQAMAEATTQAQAFLEKARREVQVERDKALLELRHEAAELALRAADEVVRASMNDLHQERLVGEYLSRLKEVIPA